MTEKEILEETLPAEEEAVKEEAPVAEEEATEEEAPVAEEEAVEEEAPAPEPQPEPEPEATPPGEEKDPPGVFTPLSGHAYEVIKEAWERLGCPEEFDFKGGRFRAFSDGAHMKFVQLSGKSGFDYYNSLSLGGRI